MWSILEVVCMWVWVCLKPPASKHTWQQKIVLSGEEKKGPHSYRLSQKNTGEDDIFFPFFFCLFIFLRSHFVSNMRACHCPSSKISGWHWPDFTVFFLLFHPPPPATSRSAPSSGPAPQHRIRPIGRERWGGTRGPTADQSELELFVLLPLLQFYFFYFFFESAAVGRVSGFSWLLVGQVRVKGGRVMSPPCRVCWLACRHSWPPVRWLCFWKAGPRRV